MAGALQAVRGMNDVLPDDASLWEFFEDTVRDVFRQYGYRNIRTPIVEKTELFVRGVGEVTDIVEKEMYTFDDNGESLSLRPEGTAPTVRAALEHNLLYDGPKRLWYSGPLFRHERPQKGRYREYHTFGAEALGFPGPDIDIELLVMVQRLWQRLGLTGITLELNTIGSADERRAFRDRLIAHFEQTPELLDADAKRRLHTNPLRILDSKNPAMQEVIEAAPKLWDTLGQASRTLFEEVQDGVREAGIAFRVNPRLVRGLDYYNATVFEWVTTRLGAQSAVCSGGRYDGLFEQLGGQAYARVRLRHRHRAHASSPAGRGTQGRRLAVRVRRARGHSREPVGAPGSGVAARRRPCHRVARRRGQLQGTDEESRCERRSLRAGDRRR